jgi:hypothetical protein
MKTLITTVAAILIATTATAEMQIVNPGSEAGAFRQVLSTIGETIDHTFVQANNPVTAFSYMQGDNILTMWSSEWPGDTNLQSPLIDAENLVALMTYETMMCSRTFTSLSDMSGQQVKLATWGSEPVANFLADLGSAHNIDFVVVPFDGSGSTTTGYIAGDADTVFTITSRQAVIQEDSSTRCIAFSSAGDLGFRFVDVITTVNTDVSITAQLRATTATLSKSVEWLDMFKGSTTYVGGTEDNLAIFNEAVLNFSK